MICTSANDKIDENKQKLISRKGLARNQASPFFMVMDRQEHGLLLGIALLSCLLFGQGQSI